MRMFPWGRGGQRAPPPNVMTLAVTVRGMIALMESSQERGQRIEAQDWDELFQKLDEMITAISATGSPLDCRYLQ